MTELGRRAVATLCYFGALGTILMLSSCGSNEKAAALPSLTRPTRMPASTPSAHDEEEVKKAYTATISLLDHVDSLPIAVRKQQLSQFMGEPQLSRVLGGIQKNQSENHASYGKIVTHIRSLEITGNSAILHDCQDSSRTGLLDVTSGKKINRGVKEERVKAHLSRDSGRWIVTDIATLGQGC
ncbi:hypothetical protein [Actinomadura litoris]|uniref:Lipoprotein n=1 Tax=Actinomadura litoris TaxID=2678616 RepID=A0A7K1KT55_9ACTN|nr:hypothetical protein [Actinomadura litoris]MUN35371.1 hypothetical protein [Actinomadura litoris]